MKYLIGKILKPRGLKGELKVQILTNLTHAFEGLKKVYLGKTAFEVEKSSVQNAFAYIKLKSFDTIESVEDFRNAKVYVTKSILKLEADDILQDDLVGFEIVNQKGKKIGDVVAIESFGERVVLNSDKFSFPYEDDFVVETDIDGRKITVRELMLVTEEVR